MNVPNIGHKTRVKVCGLTRASDVHAACDAGVDYVGFMLTSVSKRHIGIERARFLADALPLAVTPVLVVVNPDDVDVTAIHDYFTATELDYIIQFHGRETPARCAEVAQRLRRTYWRAIAVDPSETADQTQALINYMHPFPGAQAMLLDSAIVSSAASAAMQFGGTGHAFDWNLVNWSHLQQSAQSRLVLSGGLSAANVAAGIAQARPWAVDVSSGVEQRAAHGGQLHGIKDPELIAKFVAAVRAQDTLGSAQTSHLSHEQPNRKHFSLPAT